MSQYHYVVRNPNHPPPRGGHRRRRHPSSRTSPAGRRSRRTTARCGRSRATSTPFGGCSEEMLERAKRNIEERFSFVGITERFDESLVLLRRTFGWKPPYYVAANVTPASRKEPVPESTRGLIEEMNTLDRRLYEWSGERFSEAIAASPGFDGELQRFCRRNRRYQPIGRLSTPCRSGSSTRWFGPDPEGALTGRELPARPDSRLRAPRARPRGCSAPAIAHGRRSPAGSTSRRRAAT